MGNISKWKESLAERILARKSPSLMQLVYGESTNNSTSMDEENDSSEDEENGDFFIPKEEVKKVSISTYVVSLPKECTDAVNVS